MRDARCNAALASLSGFSWGLARARHFLIRLMIESSTSEVEDSGCADPVSASLPTVALYRGRGVLFGFGGSPFRLRFGGRRDSFEASELSSAISM